MLPFALLLLAATAAPAHAQNNTWGDLSVSGVWVNYDLSGNGNTPGVAVRSTVDLTPSLIFEYGGVVAMPDQQFGSSQLLMPEAHLRYQWRLGRVRPYVSAGMGASFVRSVFQPGWDPTISLVHTDWDPTISFAGGAGIRLNERVSLIGELRIRGHEWDFAGSTADVSGGIAWRLPGF